MIYHKDIGFPESLKVPEGIRNLRYSGHAKERFEGKYKGQLILPSFIRITKNNLVEVSTDDNIIINKVMVRTHYDNRKDICVVFNPNSGKVVTLWINRKDDAHDSFDKTRYTIP